MIPSNDIATGRPLLAETDACSAMCVVRHESWQVTGGSEFPLIACSNAPTSIAYAFFFFEDRTKRGSPTDDTHPAKSKGGRVEQQQQQPRNTQQKQQQSEGLSTNKQK